jgi:hypothetical protein
MHCQDIQYDYAVRFSLFRDFTQHRSGVSVVLECLTLEVGTDRLSRNVGYTTILHRVKSQKSADLLCNTAEASIHARSCYI